MTIKSKIIQLTLLVIAEFAISVFDNSASTFWMAVLVLTSAVILVKSVSFQTSALVNAVFENKITAVFVFILTTLAIFFFAKFLVLFVVSYEDWLRIPDWMLLVISFIINMLAFLGVIIESD